MSEAAKYWDNFYTQNPYARGQAPLEFLVKFQSRLKKGKLLDIGMGEGQNAVYLAKQGFDVKGFDISEVAINNALNLAKENSVSIDVKKADLDLFLMGIMEYDSVIMTYFKPSLSRYYYEIIRTLKQGGTLLIESFTTEELKEPIPFNKSYMDYYYHSNELLRYLKGMRILFYSEGIENAKHVVQCFAQKMSDKDAIKYNLFNMHTQEKEVTKSTHQKLAEAFFKKTDKK